MYYRIEWAYSIGYQPVNSTSNVTLAPNTLNTFRIVENLTSVVLLSILEIWAFLTPTSSPSCS